MGIFKPAWMTKNNSRRHRAERLIDSEVDQEKLFEIAMNAPLDTVRNYAIVKMTDQMLLSKIAQDTSDSTRSWSRCVAIRMLTNENILCDIVEHDENYAVREAAVKNPYMHNEKILTQIAEHDKNYIVREAAIKNPYMHNEKALTDIAKNDSSDIVRKTAKIKLYREFKICLHEFIFGSPYHPDNTGRSVVKATCTICGVTEIQDNGWDDYW